MERMTEFLSMAAKELPDIQISTAGVTLVIGFLNCFLGYRLRKVWISLTGFSMGAMAGYMLASRYTRSSLAQIGAIVLAGLLLGMVSFYIYRMGVFLLCTHVAMTAAGVLLQPEDLKKFIICLAAAVVLGLLGAAFAKPMVIFHTALGGGFSIAASMAGMLHREADVKILCFGAALAVAGMVVQAVTSREPPDD